MHGNTNPKKQVKHIHKKPGSNRPLNLASNFVGAELELAGVLTSNVIFRIVL